MSLTSKEAIIRKNHERPTTTRRCDSSARDIIIIIIKQSRAQQSSRRRAKSPSLSLSSSGANEHIHLYLSSKRAMPRAENVKKNPRTASEPHEPHDLLCDSHTKESSVRRVCFACRADVLQNDLEPPLVAMAVRGCVGASFLMLRRRRPKKMVRKGNKMF